MESSKIILWLLVGLVIIGIFFISTARIFGQERVQEIVYQNLTQPLVLTLVNYTVEIERPEIIGSTYFYDLTLTPKLLVKGEGSGQDVIAVIRFKDHSGRAEVGTRDFFTIGSDDIVKPVLRHSFSSGVPPITAYRDVYPSDRPLKEGQEILIRNGENAALVSVNIYRINSPLPDFVDGLFFECKAVFQLEGGCVPGKIKFTDPMIGCKNEESPPSDCYQSIGICDGTATIQVSGEPDCSANKVSTQIDYTGGTKFDAGEIILVSFWKKTSCTENKTDFQQLITLCPDDRIGGEFSINAGIIRGFDA